MTSIDIFTDGACSGNPGPGGWGAILRTGEHEKELSGGDRATTNNRMELTAVIRALEALKRPSAVTIHTDSRYVMDGVTQWMPRWKKNGWKTADKKPVKNEDLWRELDALCAKARAQMALGARPFRTSGKRTRRCAGPRRDPRLKTIRSKFFCCRASERAFARLFTPTRTFVRRREYCSRLHTGLTFHLSRSLARQEEAMRRTTMIAALVSLVPLSALASMGGGYGGGSGGYGGGSAGGGISAVGREEAETALHLIQKEDYADAIPHLKRALNVMQGNADILNLLGFTERMVGNYPDSLDYYQRALARNPDHKGAHEYLGELYLAHASARSGASAARGARSPLSRWVCGESGTHAGDRDIYRRQSIDAVCGRACRAAGGNARDTVACRAGATVIERSAASPLGCGPFPSPGPGRGEAFSQSCFSM